ncbi:MAG: oxidoreductase [Spirochaetaceae bacterium]|nr:MAG: oxidoreductase [Spirochaetaceae bacterium]
MSNTINTGLVSFGKASRVFHGPVITSIPELHLKTVVERHREESRAVYPWVEVVSDIDTLLADPTIELVVIATPNQTHYELARKCLEAGKHVVVDKPFTTTVAHAEQLIELAARKNLVVSPFQNRRWDGDFLTLQTLLKSNLLGRLVEFESRFDRFRNYSRPGAWREKPGVGSGVFFDLGPHLIDQAVSLFGPPEKLSADIRTQRDGAETDDHFDVLLQYAGLKVTLKGGMLVRARTPRFVLNGMNGSFVKYGLDPQEAALLAGGKPGTAGWGQEDAEHWGEINTDVGGLHVVGRVETAAGNYQAFYRNIAEAIRGTAEAAVTPEQIYTTIRVIEKAFQSSREQRTVPFHEEA